MSIVETNTGAQRSESDGNLNTFMQSPEGYLSRQVGGIFLETIAALTNGQYSPITLTEERRVRVEATIGDDSIVAGSDRTLNDRQHTTITSSLSETTIVTANANYFLDIYRLIITNTSATACVVTIKDATGGTVVDVIAVPAGETRGFSAPESAAAKQSVKNNNWTATCSASVASIEVTAYFIKKS